MGIYDHQDSLGTLNSQKSIKEKIVFLHETLRAQHPFIERMAVALHDSATDLLSTFVYSSESDSPLTNYQEKLSNCPSLMEMLEKNQPRVINDMDLFAEGQNKHTKVINEAGFRASYTLPLFAEGVFLGFLFFNSSQADVFEEKCLTELDMTGHLIAFMLFSEQSKIKTLVATVRSARDISHHRDPETGFHLERMSHYSRLIAQELADDYGFNDQYIEHIFLFSPLHDIGKITIPDNILLKPGKLTEGEFTEMRKHSENGREIIDNLLMHYGLDGVEYISLLRNIALYHHEAVDGSGYPEQLTQDEIPIEARIVAVADVFDALTSHRPYKPAWSNEKAYEKLRLMAGNKLDERCVNALLDCQEQVEDIQKRFDENPFG